MNREELKRILQNPPAFYRGKPFWSWNGKLEKEELLRQIGVLNEMGFGGFFMHSRTGLKTEYLSDEWFELIRACVEKAKELNMEAWLYDEDRWPSGYCGGVISMNRENRLRFFSLYHSDEEALECEEVCRILLRYAIKLEKDKTGEDRLIDYYLVNSREEVKEGYIYAVFAEEEQKPSSFYNGYTYIDAMNKNVTEEFLRSTHEKYYEKCGDLFGTVIKGIFTDEPYRGAAFSGFSIDNKNKMNMTPYTKEIFNAYKEKYGEKLNIPEVYWRKKGVIFNETSERYVDILDDLFLNNFAKPYKEWCNSHNLIFTGHILHEDSLSIQASLTGSCMRFYEYMDFPGIDCLTKGASAYWIAKQCSSISRQLGKKLTLSELYGVTGWDMSFEEYKEIGDWQAFYGINLRCPHLSMYTMEGEGKRDYPASILHQNAWTSDWKYIEDYFSRINIITSEGERVVDTVVITPIREMWGQVRKGWNNFLTPCEEAGKIDEEYFKEFLDLRDLNIDFDYGDEEIISRYGKVVEEDGKVYLSIGKVKYFNVLLRKPFRMGEKAQEILQEFINKGGRIFSKVEELIDYSLVTVPKGVVCSIYRLGGDIWLYFLNTNLNNNTCGKISLAKEFKELNGEIIDIRNGKEKGKIDFTKEWNFAPSEELIVRLTKEDVNDIENDIEYKEIKYPEEFDYELSEHNVITLDEAVFYINGEKRKNGETESVLKIDKDARIENGYPRRSGEMIQPWFADKYITKESKVICDIKLEFKVWVDGFEKLDCFIAREDSSLSLFVNGNKVEKKSDEYWVDKCFKLYPVSLIKGENIIEMRGSLLEKEGLEAIYILGEFATDTENHIYPLPKKLKTGAIYDQGFPYYTGKIKYHTGIMSGNYHLSFDELGGSLINVYGGKEKEIIAFKPFSANVSLEKELVLELIFNRRNTFGPLHLKHCPSWIGPDSFLSEGPEYCKFIPKANGLFVNKVKGV